MADAVRTCIGIDVGGTFTDCVLTDGTSTWRAKAPTTTGEIGEGVLAAAELAAGAAAPRSTSSCPGEPLRARHDGRDQHAGLAHRPAGRPAHHERVRRDAPLRPGHADRRRGRLALATRTSWRTAPSPPSTSGSTATARWSSRSTSPRSRQRSGGWSKRRASRPSPSPSSGPLPTRPTRTRRWPPSPRSIPTCPWSRAPRCTRPSASTSAPPSPFSNAYVSGAFGGIEELEEELGPSGTAEPAAPRALGRRLDHGRRGRRRPLGLAMSGPAAGVAAAVAMAT